MPRPAIARASTRANWPDQGKRPRETEAEHSPFRARLQPPDPDTLLLLISTAGILTPAYLTDLRLGSLVTGLGALAILLYRRGAFRRRRPE